MASRYTIEAALEAIFDDDFRLSDGDSSDEDSDDIYGYVREPVLRGADVRDLGESIVSDPSCRSRGRHRRSGSK